LKAAKVDTETVKIEDLMDSDPEIEFIEKDSGMSSLGGSKDETPERRAVAAVSKNVVAPRWLPHPAENQVAPNPLDFLSCSRNCRSIRPTAGA